VNSGADLSAGPRLLYGSFVASPDHRTRYPGAIKRFLRWQPVNYWQVWLIAMPLFLVWFIGSWCVLREPLIGLAFGSIAAIANGAVQSYRLGKRRDAAATAEWTPARHLPPPEP
jgi:hypothetical protein